jgi:hypothetical protein
MEQGGDEMFDRSWDDGVLGFLEDDDANDAFVTPEKGRSLLRPIM